MREIMRDIMRASSKLTVTTDGCGIGWLSRAMMYAGEGGVVGHGRRQAA